MQKVAVMERSAFHQYRYLAGLFQIVVRFVGAAYVLPGEQLPV
jgi:hypothetical protein